MMRISKAGAFLLLVWLPLSLKKTCGDEIVLETRTWLRPSFAKEEDFQKLLTDLDISLPAGSAAQLNGTSRLFVVKAPLSILELIDSSLQSCTMRFPAINYAIEVQIPMNTFPGEKQAACVLSGIVLSGRELRLTASSGDKSAKVKVTPFSEPDGDAVNLTFAGEVRQKDDRNPLAVLSFGGTCGQRWAVVRHSLERSGR